MFALLITGIAARWILRGRAARPRMIAHFREVAKKYGGQVVKPTVPYLEDFRAVHMQIGEVVVDMFVSRPTMEASPGVRVAAVLPVE